jgi:hypothetical protein
MNLSRIDLISNVDKIHTTAPGKERVRRNLCLDTEDVVSWCKDKVMHPGSRVVRAGKNWHVYADGCKITINAGSYTIITAHQDKA